MKRVLWAATVVVLVLGALGQGQIREEAWARLPDTEKLAFRVQDAGGRTTLLFQGFILTCANLRAFMADPEDDCTLVGLVTLRFDGRTPMFVFVGNPSGSAQSFSPTTFVFRQGGRQWGLGGDDFFEMHAPFSGSIPSGTVGSGFIAIPAEVDLAESFRLEYGSAFGVLTPRTVAASPDGEEESPSDEVIDLCNEWPANLAEVRATEVAVCGVRLGMPRASMIAAHVGAPCRFDLSGPNPQYVCGSVTYTLSEHEYVEGIAIDAVALPSELRATIEAWDKEGLTAYFGEDSQLSTFLGFMEQLETPRGISVVKVGAKATVLLVLTPAEREELDRTGP